MDSAKKAQNVLESRLEALRALDTELETQIPIWRDRTVRALKDLVHAGELKNISTINTRSWEGDQATLDRHLVELIQGIDDNPELYLPEEAAPEGVHRALPNNVAFVVHGHDALAKVELARTLEQLGVSPIVLHEQPNYGKTIIEKFEGSAARASFAVVLLTPDDVGHPVGKTDETKPRARQNVILELGYFLGSLGRERVFVLYKGNVEVPTDYLGVIYIPMDENGAWRFAIAKELRAGGAIVDLNKLV